MIDAWRGAEFATPKCASLTRILLSCLFLRNKNSFLYQEEERTQHNKRGCGCYAHVSLALGLSHVQPFVTSWTVACQAPLSMGFPSKHTGWVALSFSKGSSWSSLHLSLWQPDSLPLSHPESLFSAISTEFQNRILYSDGSCQITYYRFPPTWASF